MTIEGDLRAELSAALRGLCRGLPRPVDPAFAATVSEKIGDALRLDLPVPAELTRWLAGASLDDLAHVVRALTDELAQIQLPATAEWQGSAFDDLERAVTARDRLESSIFGFARVCASKRLAPADVAGLEKLLEELSRFDRALGTLADRETIEAGLGDRRAFLGVAGWTHRLAGAAQAQARPDASPVAPVALGNGESPPDLALDAYVHHGRHKMWVEGLADLRPSFHDDLQQLIDALDGLGEPLSLQALTWRRRARRSADAAPVVRVSAPRKAAAAANQQASDAVPTPLGRLDPVDAEAELVAASDALQLRIFAEPGRVVSVHLGEASAVAPQSSGEWFVEVPYPTEAVRLRVVGADGALFETELLVELTGR